MSNGDVMSEGENQRTSRLESRLGVLEHDVQGLGTAVAGLQASNKDIVSNLALLLDRVSGLSAGSDRLPKEFIGTALTVMIGFAGLTLTAIGVAAAIGVMFVNLQIQRLDAEIEGMDRRTAVYEEAAVRHQEAVSTNQQAIATISKTSEWHTTWLEFLERQADDRHRDAQGTSRGLARLEGRYETAVVTLRDIDLGGSRRWNAPEREDQPLIP